MPRKIDFRHYGDAALIRIGNDVADLVLGVEAAVAYAVVAVPVVAYHGAVAPGADFGKARILVDLYAPALVFGEVPVEAVELVDGHRVQYLLDLILAEEVPAAVQHQAAVAKARGVRNVAARQAPSGSRVRLRAVNSHRQHLPEGLDGIQEAAEAACAHLGCAPPYADGISFRGNGIILDETHSPATFRDFARLAASKRQFIRKALHRTGAARIHSRVAIQAYTLHVKGPAGHLHAQRRRDNVQGRSLRSASAEHCESGES